MGRGDGEGEGEGRSCDDDDHQHHLLHHHPVMSEDVLIQILLWLPVISLLRFKSVCKSWHSIIESNFFIHLHATTKLGGSSSSFIFLGYHSDDEEEKKGNIFKVSGEGFEVFEDLGRPPLLDLGEYIVCLKEWEEFSVVGCCNGIICLHDCFTRNIALWNPALKQSRLLPKPSNPLGNPNYFEFSIEPQHNYWAEDFVRFGFDIKTNDYKVLLITSITTNFPPSAFSESPGKCRVHVYSLSTDSWRCIEEDNATLSDAHPDPDHIHIERLDSRGMYLNGSYFFRVTYFDAKWMPLFLSFDFTGEIFRTIQPPFDLRDNYISGYAYFISFGENVALVDAIKEEEFPDDGVEYCIWVLNEQQHGVKESWTKFYTIGPPDSEPLCISNNGEFAIVYRRYWEKDHRQQRDGKLELLNLITGEKKILRCGYHNPSRVHVYKPSLVPTGGNGATHNSRLLELDGTP